MTTLRSTLFHLLARLFQRWASALAAQLEPARVPVDKARHQPDPWVDSEDTEGPPPEHWLEAARIEPPQHWLDTVREHAPGLLEPDSDGVIEWAADETALYSPPTAETPEADAVWDERPMPPPARPSMRRAPARARALRLLDVRASVPVARQPVKEVVSKAGRAVRLRVAGGSPHPRPLSLRARGAKQSVESISPPLVTATQQNLPATPSLHKARSGMMSEALQRFDSPRPAVSGRFAEGEGLRVRAASPRRPRVRQVRSTLAEAATPPEARRQTASPPRLTPVYESTTTPAEVKISSHHFPALLDDPRDTERADWREAERRQRLDAEQEGRSWNA